MLFDGERFYTTDNWNGDNFNIKVRFMDKIYKMHTKCIKSLSAMNFRAQQRK